MCSGDGGGGAGDGVSASVVDAIGVDTGASQGNAPGVQGGPDAATAAGAPGVGSPSSSGITTGIGLLDAIMNPQNITVPQGLHMAMGMMGVPSQAISAIAETVGQGINAVTGATNEGAVAGQAAVGSGGPTGDNNGGGPDGNPGGLLAQPASVYDPARTYTGGQQPQSIYNPGGMLTWGYTPLQAQQTFLGAPANAGLSYAADYPLLESRFRSSFETPLLNVPVYRPGSGLL